MNRRQRKTEIEQYKAPMMGEYSLRMRRNILNASFTGGTEDMGSFSGNTEEWE